MVTDVDKTSSLTIQTGEAGASLVFPAPLGREARS